MKDDGTQNYKDLEAMVKDVNANVVEACDRLSDNVYHFDDNTKLQSTMQGKLQKKEILR